MNKNKHERKLPFHKNESTLSTCQFHKMFPNEETATTWFESVRWPDGPRCPECGSVKISTVMSRKPAPYRCRDCRKCFSVRIGTVMESSHLGVRQWLYAMHLICVTKKGLSSRQLGHEVGISQTSAWRMGHKIREAWNDGALFPISGEADFDTFYAGSKDSQHQRDAYESKAMRESVSGMVL